MNGVILHAHPVRGESHNQRNTTGEVATTFPPFYNEPHQSHVLCVKVELGTTFTSWSQHHFVAIGNPERHVRKASHRGSKQQEIMLAISLTIACSRYTYDGVILHAHPVRGESHNQHNTTREVATILYFNFCKFTLWIPPSFGCPGPPPRAPPPSVRHWRHFFPKMV